MHHLLIRIFNAESNGKEGEREEEQVALFDTSEPTETQSSFQEYSLFFICINASNLSIILMGALASYI